MADAIVPPANTNGEAPPPAPAAEQNAEVAELKAEIAKLKAYNAQQRVAAKTPPPTPEPAEEPTLKEQIRQLKEERRLEREQAAADRRKLGISTAIAGHQIAGDSAKELEARLHYEFGAHIKLENGETVYEDPETGVKSTVGEFIAEKFLKAGKYKPAPAPGPDAKGLARGGSGSGARRTFGELSLAEQDELMKSGKAAAYVKEDMASGR